MAAAMLTRRKPPRSGIRDMDGPIRSPSHLQFVRGFCCAAMGDGCSGPIQAHHVSHAGEAAMGQKVGDDYAVPLCAAHHAEVHSLGRETFEMRHGVDLGVYAAKLAKASAHIRKAKRERGE